MLTRTTICVIAGVLSLSAQSQTWLNGKLVDELGKPAPFAEIHAQERIARADSAGSFELSELSPGLLSLHVISMGSAVLDTALTLRTGVNEVLLVMRTSARDLAGVEITALRAGDRAPFARTTIDRQEIARTNTGVDLPYLLEMQPSVVSTSDGGTGIGYTYMRIRGTDGTRTNVTLNGVPFNDAEGQGAFFVDLPDLASSAEDIEVQRGVGSSTNGPAAFGASINLRTTSVKQAAWGTLSASGGSFGTQRYSAGAGTGLLGNHLSLDMRLSSISSDGYIDRANADLKSYFVQAAWIGTGNSVRFITFRGKEVTYQAWDGVPREVIDTARTYNGFTYAHQVDDFDQANYQLLFDRKLGSRSAVNLTLFRVDGKGFYEQFRAGDELALYGIAPAVINGDTITTTDLVRRRWLDNTLTGANVSMDTRFGKQRLVIGGSYSDYRCAHFGEVIWARYAGDTDIGHRYYDDGSKKTDANGFAKLTCAVNDRIDLYGDAQLRHVTYSFLGIDDAFENRQQELRWMFFNPKAGVLWRVRKGDKAYASLAVGNREPNRDDVQETTPTSRPRAERLVDYELGFERRRERYSVAINAYFMDYDDQLVLSGELNDVGAALRTNVKSSYRAGIELSGAVQVNDRLRWRANATFSRNKVRDYTEFVDDWDNGGQVSERYSESDLAFSPAVIAGSELSYRVWALPTKGNAEITLVTKYVGDQFLDNSASAERRLDAYLVNDIRANVTVLCLKGTKGVDLNLTVRNVFSELYESNGWVYSYRSDGRRQEMVGLFPQAPVNVLGGVTVRF